MKLAVKQGTVFMISFSAKEMLEEKYKDKIPLEYQLGMENQIEVSIQLFHNNNGIFAELEYGFVNSQNRIIFNKGPIGVRKEMSDEMVARSLAESFIRNGIDIGKLIDIEVKK